MLRAIPVIFATGLVAVAGLGFQPTPLLKPTPATQPGEEHPPGGHPTIPRPAADWPKARAEDVKSIDAIIAAFYESTAAEPKQPRDWDRFRSLFLPESRLIAARPAGDGTSGAVFLAVTDYVAANRKYFEKGGFIDSEAARRVEQYGNIAQVWSTYESRHSKADPKPYARGINSIQLLKDGDRWWIVNVFWDFERAESAIPDKYLHSPKD